MEKNKLEQSVHKTVLFVMFCGMKPFRALLIFMTTLTLLVVSSRFMPKNFIGKHYEQFASKPTIVSDSVSHKKKRTDRSDSLQVCSEEPKITILPDSFSLSFWADRLTKSDEKAIRWLYFGDSQLEGDRITAQLRAKLQNKYGGSGIGLLPLKNSYLIHANLNMCFSKDWIYETIFDFEIHDLGMVGRSCIFRPSSSEKQGEIILKNIDKKSPIVGSIFSLYYSSADSQARLRLQVNKQKELSFKLSSDSVLNHLSLAFNSDVYELKLNFESAQNLTIHGIELRDSSGVYVDNIALRGGIYPQFSKMNRTLLTQMLNRTNPSLIAIHFGVNLVPDIRNNYKNYTIALMREIGLLKSLVPQVPILVVGVSDMARKENKGWYSYPNIDAVKQAQKRAALATGCGFWDLSEAMGGKQSIVSWVKHKPRLANRDYIHFSKQGTDSVANMLGKAIEFQLKKERAND